MFFGVVQVAVANELLYYFLDFSNLDDILIRQRLVGLVVLGVLEQHLVHVRGSVLVESIGAAEDNQSNLAVAQHRQFVGFLHDAEFTLVERHL